MEEFYGFLAIIAITCIITMGITAYKTKKHIMTEAYEQGVAFECMGKTGYHFTCDDVKK